MNKLTLPEVDEFIEDAVYAGKQTGRLRSSFAITQESKQYLKDLLENKIENGDTYDSITSSVVAYLSGYANGIVDMASFVEEHYNTYSKSGING